MDYFTFYKETYKGALSKEMFEELLPKSLDIMQLFANILCNSFLTLEEYGDFNKALCYQIDCLNTQGSGTINGEASEKDITEVKTANYTINYFNKTKSYFDFQGLPFSTMTRYYMINELTKNGHYRRLVYDTKLPKKP